MVTKLDAAMSIEKENTNSKVKQLVYWRISLLNMYFLFKESPVLFFNYITSSHSKITEISWIKNTASFAATKII